MRMQLSNDPNGFSHKPKIGAGQPASLTSSHIEKISLSKKPQPAKEATERKSMPMSSMRPSKLHSKPPQQQRKDIQQQEDENDVSIDAPGSSTGGFTSRQQKQPIHH